jgi:predicted Zn-dependent protease
MSTLRLALLTLAVLAGAWFVVGLRQAHETDQLSALLSHGISTPAQDARAKSLANAAAFLYPGQDIPILRARVAFAAGHTPQAERILRAVTRREPQNLSAWALLAAYDLNNAHHAGVAAAEAHFAQLDPVDAG